MKKYLKHYLWAFVAVTVVAVAVLVTVHGLRNLGADSHSDSVAGARPKSETGASTGPGRECVGTRPVGSLPGLPLAEDDTPWRGSSPDQASALLG
jgi:hypothetical protein